MNAAEKLRTLAADIENGYGLLRDDREAIRAILRALADRVDEAEQPKLAGAWPCKTLDDARDGLRRIAKYHRSHQLMTVGQHEKAAQFADELQKCLTPGPAWGCDMAQAVNAPTANDVLPYARAAVRAAEDRDAARALLCRSLGRDPSEPLEALVGELIDKTEALLKQNERLINAVLGAIESAQK